MPKEIFVANISDYFTKTLEATFLLREIEEKEPAESRQYNAAGFLRYRMGYDLGRTYD